MTGINVTVSGCVCVCVLVYGKSFSWPAVCLLHSPRFLSAVKELPVLHLSLLQDLEERERKRDLLMYFAVSSTTATPFA